MFYVQIMGSDEGPLSPSDVVMGVRGGRYRADTPARRADQPSSTFRVADIPGIFSDKEWTSAVLLSLFVGILGIDRFYLGYTGMGIVKLLTFGGCGFIAIYDLITIAMNKMNDSQGRPLRR